MPRERRLFLFYTRHNFSEEKAHYEPNPVLRDLNFSSAPPPPPPNARSCPVSQLILHRFNASGTEFTLRYGFCGNCEGFHEENVRFPSET